MASENTSAIIIACKIFEAAEGLRPNARILAYPIAAITADGPIMVTNITRTMIKLSILTPLLPTHARRTCDLAHLQRLLFNEDHALISVKFDHPPANRNFVFPIHQNITRPQQAHNWRMVVQYIEFCKIARQKDTFSHSLKNRLLWTQYSKFHRIYHSHRLAGQAPLAVHVRLRIVSDSQPIGFMLQFSEVVFDDTRQPILNIWRQLLIRFYSTKQ